MFEEGFLIVYGGIAIFGIIAAIYFYIQDKREEREHQR